VEQVSYSI
jgi:hypothetical protein